MAIKFNRSQTFATNGTVTAAGLHNLIDGTDIYQALITDQPSLTAVAPEDSILIADASLTAGDAPRQTTVSNLFDDALTGGTYTGLNLTGNLTFGTATGNRTVSTSATITTGTIPNLTSSTANITLGTIPILTAGTTTSTAATITSGTITNLASTTGTIATLNSTTGTIATLNSTTGTIATLNSTTGTITNLSTTLAGDFTISNGTGTLGTSGATAGTYGSVSAIPFITVDAKGRITSATTGTFSSTPADGSITLAKLSTSSTEADNVKKRTAIAFAVAQNGGTLQSGGFGFSSVTDGGSGILQLNFNFTASTNAVAVATNHAAGAMGGIERTGLTTSAVTYQSRNSGGSPQDCNISCIVFSE